MAKHILTKDDIKRNPLLKKYGCKEGDEIEIPDQIELDDFEENDDDTGGSNPPPNKGRG